MSRRCAQCCCGSSISPTHRSASLPNPRTMLRQKRWSKLFGGCSISVGLVSNLAPQPRVPSNESRSQTTHEQLSAQVACHLWLVSLEDGANFDHRGEQQQISAWTSRDLLLQASVPPADDVCFAVAARPAVPRAEALLRRHWLFSPAQPCLEKADHIGEMRQPHAPRTKGDQNDSSWVGRCQNDSSWGGVSLTPNSQTHYIGTMFWCYIGVILVPPCDAALVLPSCYLVVYLGASWKHQVIMMWK